MRSNLEAFRRWRIVPRALRDLSSRDLSTELLGTQMPAPVLAPMASRPSCTPMASLPPHEPPRSWSCR